MAEDGVNTNVAPVHWASGVSITAPKEGDSRNQKSKGPKRAHPSALRNAEPPAGEDTGSSHELDSFA